MTHHAPAPVARRVTPVRVVRSEWTKLRSLASTIWCLAATVALVVGVGVAYAALRVARPPADPSTFDPTSVSLAGVQLAPFAIGVLGVLFVSGEYATGSIRVSLAAVPGRLPVLWGKAVTFGLATVAVAVPAAVVAFVAGQSVLSAEHLDTGLGQPGVGRAVLGSAWFLTVVGLLGLGLGTLLRNTAAGISALFGLLFAPQLVLGLLPESVADAVYRYLPTPAGAAVTAVRQDPDTLGPWTGFGLFCLYTAVVLGLAAWRLRRRDV
ncbi:ABC-type transport system involved in multi-copper enzyme maturation permease subunit [Krasilnikovia cinnamomea]|uniref:ABC-type transport system involved in multi-copper enzyme maturation permease subunit n=1 Tax=Krasilnikovia cinnamomea TaxID=349313 RepID=A0A4Q7ZMW4_9ACTN|nr:ABC-type transport system involved in multi-copper enzyme maturation permease subunit [Krasilnikovia cinnamomea]